MKINHDTIEKHTGRVVIALMGQNVKRATAFLSPGFVISASRHFPKHKSATREQFTIKIGKPNYEQSQFVKACQKSGVAFPLREPQLKFYNVKAKRKR